MPLKGKDRERFVADCFRDTVFRLLEGVEMSAVFFDALMVRAVYHDSFGKVSFREMVFWQDGSKRVAVYGMKGISPVFLHRMHGGAGKVLDQMPAEIELDQLKALTNSKDWFPAFYKQF